MPSLLLELYVEEIPAFMQKNAEVEYSKIFHNKFQESSIICEGLEVYIGPRRITIIAENIAPTIEAKTIEIKGPSTKAPEEAIAGFCKSNNIGKSDLVVKTIKNQECYVYLSHTQIQNVIDILPKIISFAISEYTWPKSMYWGDCDIKFVRPIRNILCLFGTDILHIKYGNLVANNMTFGHRFMSYYKTEVSSIAEYTQYLEKNYVILSRQKRIEIIEKAINDLIGLEFVLNNAERLIEEVAGLVEYPNILMGKIPEKFMHLPSEILITAMKNHQRYFTLQYSDGTFAPYFIFVSNITNKDQSDIIAGNEKVLAARLADSEYFYKQDQKSTLESRLTKLERVIFHAKLTLGSIRDKVFRVEKIVQYLMPQNKELHIAARLCKSDLVTEAVVEFPELQGIMGGYYARLEGLSDNVSNIIKEHYKPEGNEDEIPSTHNAAILALADKIDSLTSLYIAGERSSGSKDPYALRRYAVNIIRIIVGYKLNINLIELVQYATLLHKVSDNKLVEELISFIEDRLRHSMLKTYSSSLCMAVINLHECKNPYIITSKLEMLDLLIHTTEGENILSCYKRMYNILKSSKLDQELPNQAIFKQEEEQHLFQKTQSISSHIDNMINAHNFGMTIHLLDTLKTPINNFFDNVTIMDTDTKIAANRIALLYFVVSEFHKLCDMQHLLQE